jgi:TPR repeat protein
MQMLRTFSLALAVCLAPPAMAQILQDAAAKIRPLAEQGDPKCQYFLGTCYDNGIGGVSQDYAEALKWYRKAAEQGHGDALASMAGMYAGGYGVPKNYMLAEMYVELAEAQHAETGTLKMTRAVVRQHVTKAQTADAKKRAAECVQAKFKGCEKI